MMNFIRLADNKEDEKLVKALYNKAFPVQERMPYFILKYKSKKGNADFFKSMMTVFLSACVIVFFIRIYCIFFILLLMNHAEVKAMAAGYCNILRKSTAITELYSILKRLLKTVQIMSSDCPEKHFIRKTDSLLLIIM